MGATSRGHGKTEAATGAIRGVVLDVLLSYVVS